MTNPLDHNRDAWNRQSAAGQNRWCQPVDGATIARARAGDWSIVLTPTAPVPRAWFGDLAGKRVLCLASGGGQQAPVLAAAGARVTSFDNADEQLARDAEVAAREGLVVACVQGDMADLGCFDDGCFDLIFHPVSNVFAESVRPVWRECNRVLVANGRLLAGFMNPAYFLFDHDAIEAGGPLEVSYALPYSDLRDLPAERIEQLRQRGEPLAFGHSLDDQIGGQLDAGFVLAGFYEDRWEDAATPLNAKMPTSMATLALKNASA